MTHRSHRGLTALAIAAALTTILAGCVATGGSGAVAPPKKDAPGAAILQSRFSDELKGGMPELIAAFNAKGKGKVTLNTIPTETYRQQLPTFLTAKNPPDTYTWFAGEATRAFANQNLLLNISDVWDKNMTKFPSALKALSKNDKGQEVFVPTNYYWWGMYYRKSEFAKLGVTPPKTWDEFITLSKTIKSKGVTPISIGLSDNPWLASAWFDYLDVRINGGKFHLDLLAGKHQFDDPKVKLVFEKLKEVLPYFSKSALGVSYNQSMSDLAQGKAAMYLCGAFISGAVPKDVKGDLGFFQFPIIDPSVPVVEEAPADGFIASAGTTRPNLTKRFLAFAASTEGQEILMKAQGDAALAANPDVHITLGPLAQQGKEMLESAAQVTQFFNRDAGDALQPTADAALTQFFSQPQNVDAILATWQKAAAKARAGS